MELKITPKRRKRFLEPKNIAAWIGAFIRRDLAAAPVALDLIVNRYLEDTKAGDLRDEPKSMESLRQGIVDAMLKTWDLQTGDDDMASNARLLDFLHKGNKSWFTIPAGTVLNTGSGFNHKELSEAGTLTAGTACVYNCSYCSVGATMFRSPQTRILRLLGIEHRDAVIRRLDPAAILRNQLTFRDGAPRYRDPNDRRTVILSPIVDPLPSIEFLEESLELISIIHELTCWDVRVLTKSMLIKKLAERIPKEHRDRVIYGLSLGILDDDIGKAVERLTSRPSARLKAYHDLQSQGLRTYSMHCPILPQENYRAYAERLAASVNWQKDEQVWAEALNRRGESNKNTITALEGPGFSAEAELLADVTHTHAAWEFGYNRPLFEAIAEVCPPGKLRYLVYAADADRDYWLGQRDRGAVVLGDDIPLEDESE
jgi:DNA repair photolyase